MIDDEWQQCFSTDIIERSNHGSGKNDFSGSGGVGFNDDDEDNFSLLLMESDNVQMPTKYPEAEGQPSYDQPPVVPPAPPAFNVQV